MQALPQIAVAIAAPMPPPDLSSSLPSGLSSNVSNLSSSMSGISGSNRAFSNGTGQPHSSTFAATMQQEMNPISQPSMQVVAKPPVQTAGKSPVQATAQSGTLTKSVSVAPADQGNSTAVGSNAVSNATSSGASTGVAASSSAEGSLTGSALETSQPVNAAPPKTVSVTPARVVVTAQTVGDLTGATTSSATSSTAGFAENSATSTAPNATKRKAETMSPAGNGKAGNGSGTPVPSTQAMVVVPIVVALPSSSPSKSLSSDMLGANVSNLSGSPLPLRSSTNGSTQNAMKGTPIAGLVAPSTTSALPPYGALAGNAPTNAPVETGTAGATGMTGTTGTVPNLVNLRSEALAVAPGIPPEALPKGVGSEIGPKASTPTIASATVVNAATTANAAINKESTSAVQSNAQSNVQSKAQTGSSAFPAQPNGSAASSTGAGVSSAVLNVAASGNAASGAGAGAGSGAGGSATGNAGNSGGAGNAGGSATAALPSGDTSQGWTHAPGTTNSGTTNFVSGGTVAAVSSVNSVPGTHGIAPAGAPPVAGQGVAGASANPLTATGGGSLSLPQGARLPSATSPTASDAFAALDHVSGEPNRLLYATPHQLAVGVADPQLGWLEVRAERSGGQLMAQVTADSASSHAVLAASLPAMTSYLQEQRAGVQSLAVTAQLAGHAGQNAGQSSGQGTPHQNTSGGSGQQPPAAESRMSGTSAVGAVAGVGVTAGSGVFAAETSVGQIPAYLQGGHQVSLHA